ncbi:uncharacterized protein [Procambarus clarkii]|uniref:uncharacterized protein n=1 Tax=Procambarus clarkii TaxID=6728 RepID=UPI0037428472
MAQNQLRSQVLHLQRQPENLKLYHEIIQKQLDDKFIEVVTNDNPKEGHYLPHHHVQKDSATTPLRIVFNCSAKMGQNSVSLNDCLQTGPSLTQRLYDVLLKFRIGTYAYTADISKAFLRVGLQEEDRNYTKFLWIKDPNDPNSEIITYRFASVLFGATSSPFLLQATLDTHLKKSNSPNKTEISENLYVDNFQGTANSESKLLDIYHEANRELMGANMPLQSWVSNNDKLKQLITTEFPDYQVPEMTKVLGVQWNTTTDQLTIKSVETDTTNLTMRKLLSQVSKPFDPLGLLSPILINGKMIIQECWQQKIGWDDLLTPALQEKWQGLVKDLSILEPVKFPRNTTVNEKEPIKLHVFCDASGKAYGTVAYLVSNGQANLLTSKARVAPLKKRSLPQLELTALLLGVRLAHYLIKALSHIHFTETVVWSDNEAVLQWVKNNNSKNPYVSNRVKEIRELSAGYKLRYVPTKENPADYLSRGLTLRQLTKAEMWFNGPQWLISDQWPEQKPQVIVTNVTVPTENPELPQTLVIDPTRYSELNKLVGVTQVVFDFLKKIGIKHNFPSALRYWVKRAQTDTFGTEIDNVPKKLQHDLGLWLDTDNYNLIRCGGRLQHADIDLEAKNPILLPRHHIVSKLIVLHIHKYCTLHGGVLDTLTELRQQYWLPQGRQTVKSIIKSCVVCRRYDARVCPYPGPPPLPKERVVHIHPFETTGVDFTGALTLTGTKDKKPVKAYICLFTCATTRAVHLEVTPDMSAEAFLQAFCRFASRRSCPKLMISDNGSNLVAGEACLRKIWTHPKVRTALTQRQCYWKFIPPRAPWHGGFYERMVGTVKRSLRKTLHRQKIDLQELQTVIIEIEARVNNRPLTYLSDDALQREPLSPAHLMYGRPLKTLVSLTDEEPEDPSYVKESDLVQRFKHLSGVISRWNDVWTREYLTALREYHYGANSPYNRINLNPGDIVLVDSDGPRSEWPIGEIVSVHPDSQGILRIVKVKCKGNTTLKTLEKLVPLELARKEDVQRLPAPDTPVRDIRPQRTAAQQCKLKLKQHYNSEGEE